MITKISLAVVAARFPIFPEGSNTAGLLAGLLLDSQSETSLILYRPITGPITMLLSNVLCLLSIVYGIFILCQLLSRSLSLTEFWVSHDLSLIFSAMSTSQSNRQASEFRTILSRINEIKTSLQGSDREEVSKKLDEMNDSLRIIEGNQADFSDAMFKAVERMQKSVEDSLKL